MGSRALAPGLRQGWLWPLSVGALAAAGSAVFRPHYCSLMLELSADEACQGFERLYSDLS